MFTVVGLVVLVIATALVTNAIRRRRAQKFDRDVAEAAREAAAAAHASPPDFHGFDDEDYVYGNSSGSGGGGGGVIGGAASAGSGGGYTDATHTSNMTRQTSMTHGSYNQPPMQPAGPFESFGMAELPGAGGSTYPGVVNNVVDPWNANANSAGVGAAGLNRAKSATAPYNAFAGPPPVAGGGGGAYYDGRMPAPHTAINMDPFNDNAGVPVGGVYNGMQAPSFPQAQPYNTNNSIVGSSSSSSSCW